MWKGHGDDPRPATGLEAILRHDRAALALLVVVLPAVCWWWIVAMARDMYGPMTGASAWMMTLDWDARHLLLLWAMWAVMMAAMMLPTAAPLLLLFGAGLRRRGGAAALYAMAAGYVVVWALFSVVAIVLQRWMAGLLLISPMMEMVNPTAAALTLLLAGVYQFTPWKLACLRVCGSPVSFLMSRSRPGTAGAFRMGAEHGLYCLGCCWALMLLLFVGGVMNLAVILALTVFVVFEKFAPFGVWTARVSGALLVGAGVWMLVT